MEQKSHSKDSDVPTVEEVELEKTTIGDHVDDDLLAYIVRSEAAIYVATYNLARVAAHLNAEVKDQLLIIRKGKPFAGDNGFLLKCDIKPMESLQAEQLVGIGDGKVRQGEVCSLVAPFTCVNVVSKGVFSFSHKAPSYGMSICIISAGDTCDSWVAQENCDTFTGQGCQPPPAVNRLIAAYVCSMP